MYESHFGFSGPPFQLNPDPAFYFNSRGHGHALAYLRYGVSQGEGFIVVTGEIGAGKTTLLRALLDELDRAQVVAAQIVSTQLESGDLLQAIITAFGIPTQGNGKASLISTLEAFLMTLATQGRRALLIIDEAQNLEIRAIEELRMLSNFQLGTQSLLQSFLVGQPELRKKLESQEMEQLRQRVTASCHLGPLGLEETRGYVEHRLKRVGWANRPAFEDTAFDQIYRWSGGVPRRINRLCNRLLLAAFLEGRDTIVAEMVESTAQELRQEIGEAAFEPLPMPQRHDGSSAATPAAAPAQAASAVPSEPPAPPVPAASSSATTPEPAAVEPPAPAVTSPPPVEDLFPVAPAQPPVAAPTVATAEVAELPTAPAAVPPEAPALATPPATRSQPPVEAVAPAIVRTEALVQKTHTGTLLCVADTTAGGLKFAAVAKALDAVAGGPRLVLINPGAASDTWPWEQMESVLPIPAVAVHLGVPRGSLEDCLPLLIERLGPVLDEFDPLGMVTLGNSDAILGCHLLAHKRGLRMLRLEAGERRDGVADESVNAALMEQISDLLFAPNSRPAHQQLYRSGVGFDKVFGVPGQLAVDVMAAALPSMTTPYGAFLRHRLPIFLGPRWSSEVDGTAYAVVTLSLDPADSEHTQSLLSGLLGLAAAPKLLWLADPATREALRLWQRTTPVQADDVFIIEDALPRTLIDQRNSARILCSDIRSLADQLSIVRGAVAVFAQPGHITADAAAIFDIPAILQTGPNLVLTMGSGEPVMLPWSMPALGHCLERSLHHGKDVEPSEGLAQSPQAAGVIAARLAAWATRQQADTSTNPQAVVKLHRPAGAIAGANSPQTLAA